MAKHSALLGTVTTATRRHVNVLLDQGSAEFNDSNPQNMRARCMRKAADIVVGDRVTIEHQRDELVVLDVEKRRNCLLRSYFSKTKLLASNLDCLFVVTAPAPLFNSLFVDKVLAFAHIEDITPVVVMNKTDIGNDNSQELVHLYRDLGYKVLSTSCKKELGLAELMSFFSSLTAEHNATGRTERTHIAFCGVSGVGKSSLLNALMPGIASRTSEVNNKTGQGKQTTSQAWGYTYQICEDSEALLTDLPGIQNFGVSKLDLSAIAFAFPEFSRANERCEYTDCRHLHEPTCGVKEDLAEGRIAQSRYESYCHIIHEIESARPY
jgi:ribosome biogenesis GTPase / thiamine phosphate phosphatase